MKVAARVRTVDAAGRVDGGAALVLPTRKTQALLAYLALPLGQAHPRGKLAGLRWGDMADAQARGNLRHALSRIFQQAVDWTRRQGILSMELRGAASLVQLWHEEGRTDAARELLAQVYGRFTEGFRHRRAPDREGAARSPRLAALT